MPTKDRPALILEAIAALQAQDFTDWELLIEDGGESVESALPRDGRIKYMRQTDPLDRRGNAALLQAQGELLNFHADDDILLPGALAHVSNVIGDCKWMYGRVNFGSGGQMMGEPWDYARLKVQNYIPAPAVFWTRGARDIVGGWDISNPRSHDWDYWLRLGARWEPLFSPRVLANYRVHPGMATAVMTEAYKAEQDETVLARARSGYYNVA
jgi:glycosyltransferase involved in cell wall biosynthesis